MKDFFKFVFASMIGVILSFFVLFILLIVIVTAIVASAGSDGKVAVSANSIMHVSLDYPISERTDKNPLAAFDFMGFDGKKTLGLNEIIAGIEVAKTDQNIKGIYLDVSSLSTGFATIEEIRNALLDFKKSGKFGFINKKGQVVIEPIYDDVENFNDGIAKVKLYNLYGFINKKGQIIIEIKYNSLSNLNDGRILYENN